MEWWVLRARLFMWESCHTQIRLHCPIIRGDRPRLSRSWPYTMKRDEIIKGVEGLCKILVGNHILSIINRNQDPPHKFLGWTATETKMIIQILWGIESLVSTDKNLRNISRIHSLSLPYLIFPFQPSLINIILTKTFISE